MRRFSSAPIWPLTAIALLASAGDASANLSMGPRIHELTQGGQNVEVTLVVDQSYLGTTLHNDGLGLVREDEHQTVELLNHALLHEEQAETIEPFCHGSPAQTDEQCEEWPEHCNDCDGDGYAECFGGCDAHCYFSVIDECVPAGRATYVLSVFHNETSEDVQWMDIEVEEAAGACLWDAEFGCLLAVPGRPPPGAPVGWPLLALGLAALLLTRIRKR